MFFFPEMLQRDSCNSGQKYELCTLTLIGQVEPSWAGLAFGGETNQDLVGGR